MEVVFGTCLSRDGRGSYFWYLELCLLVMYGIAVDGFYVVLLFFFLAIQIVEKLLVVVLIPFLVASFGSFG